MKDLTPADGILFVVRWVRVDGRDVKHRYFRRQTDAVRFFTKLDNGDREVRLFSTLVEWTGLV